MAALRSLSRCLCFLFGACGAAAHLTGGADAGDSALKSVRLFKPGDATVSCYRIPAVVSTTKGTLLAFAEARYGGCGDGQVHEIAVRRSTNHGQTWSKIAFAAGNASHLVGNPYPVALSSGRVAVLYVKHASGALDPDRGVGNGMVVSDDDGVTWSEEQDVSKGFGNASGSSPGPGAGIQLASGRILVVSHHGAYIDDYLTYSDDGGKTWTTLNHTFPGMDEATLADLGGGQVLLNMRHAAEATKGRAIARSHDGGLTWSNISYDKALIGPVCQGSVAAIGGSVYFSNQASRISRSHLTVRRSMDGGKTWSSSLLIQAGFSAGYSSLVPAIVGDAKHGGLLYEAAKHGCIDFAVFPLALKSSDPRPQLIV